MAKPPRPAKPLGASQPFGPPFFLTRLAALVRESCPSRTENLPSVLLHLVDGESIDVCHVIGLAESWVAVAAHDPGAPSPGTTPGMRTVLVPYETILRVSLRLQAADGSRIGFRQEGPPEVFVTEPSNHASAERALALVARATTVDGESARRGTRATRSHRAAAPEGKLPMDRPRRSPGDTSTSEGGAS